jgi:hypothetical protein
MCGCVYMWVFVMCGCVYTYVWVLHCVSVICVLVFTVFCIVCTVVLGHAVTQLVEALRYKLESRGFDSRLCQWNFPLS